MGGLVTADHMVGGSDDNEDSDGLHPEKIAVITLGVATNYCWVVPAATKSAPETTEALDQLWGPRGRPQLFYAGRAKELRRAVSQPPVGSLALWVLLFIAACPQAD